MDDDDDLAIYEMGQAFPVARIKSLQKAVVDLSVALQATDFSQVINEIQDSFRRLDLAAVKAVPFVIYEEPDLFG